MCMFLLFLRISSFAGSFAVVASIIVILSSKNKGIKLYRNEVQTHEEVKKIFIFENLKQQ